MPQPSQAPSSYPTTFPFSTKLEFFPSTSPPPCPNSGSFEFLGTFRKQPGGILWHFEPKHGHHNPGTFWGCILCFPFLFSILSLKKGKSDAHNNYPLFWIISADLDNTGVQPAPLLKGWNGDFLGGPELKVLPGSCSNSLGNLQLELGLVVTLG